MKSKKRKKQAAKKRKSKSPEPKPAFNLIERRFNGRRFVEFPQMKGKTVEKIELFTTQEYHSIDLHFADKTYVALVIEPCFALRAAYYDATGESDTISDEWVPVHSATSGRM
jgi:hypothetical protein